MTWAETFFETCVLVALGVLIATLLIVVVRIVRGPTLADRVLGLDMVVSVSIGFIVLVGAHTGFFLYLDVAIALGLVGFLATVAFARFILHRGSTHAEQSRESIPSPGKE